jgi:uncharacterized YigZ family protein
MDSYQTISGTSQGEYEEKKSRFIAYLAHVESDEEALAFIADIKSQHPMARHHVYAYVLRADNRVRYTDDGEPQKTAGLPTLSVLQHAQLVDVCCVVVRYFGGTLLGTGGLVRAYTKATQNAVVLARMATFAPCRDVMICVDYPLYEKLSYQLKQQGTPVVDTTFAQDVTITARVLSEAVGGLLRTVEECCQGRAEVLVGDNQLQLIEGLGAAVIEE